MAKATKKSTKSTKQGGAPQGLYGAFLQYWPHVFVALFAIYLILLGAGMIQNNVFNALHGIDSKEGPYAVGTITLGGMFLGVAINKIAYVYRKRRDSK